MIDSKLNGTVRQQDNGHFEIKFSRTLHASIREAWSALINKKERDKWFHGVSFINKRDGIIRLDFDDDGVATGKIVSINRPTEIVHTLKWQDMPTAEVSWSFVGMDDENTMVVLALQNLTSGALVDWAVGWHIILDDMVAYLEHQKMPLPDFEELGQYYSKQLVM